MPIVTAQERVRGFYAAEKAAAPAPSSGWTADLLAALSFANLLYYPAWERVLDGADNYYSRAHPNAEVLAAFASVLALAAVLLVPVRFAFRSPSRPARHLACGTLFLLPLAVFRPPKWEVYFLEMFGYTAWALLLLLLIVVARGFQRHLLTAMRIVLLCALPFVAVTFGRGLLLLPAREARAPLLPARADAPRVVWLIFDALDYRIAFAERPRELRLPEFDVLAAAGFSASQAEQPSFATKSSLPSLLTGRLVTRGTVYGTSELLIHYAGATLPARWSAERNIFIRARELGLNSALQGWYHPYCRLFGEQLADCAWWEYVPTIGMRPEGGVMERALDQWYLLGRAALRVGYHAALTRAQRRRMPADRENDARRKAQMHVEQAAALGRAATDPAIGLVVSHLGVPHLPAFYDRATREFALTGSYLDNLALADRTLGELRLAMQQAGIGERTVLVISSDHAFRSRSVGAHWIPADQPLFEGHTDTRVPFLVYFPQVRQRIAYRESFNTVVTHDLILAILRGDVQSPQQTAEWLQRHAHP